MESTHDPSAVHGGPPPAGELVVQNGRLAGARHPLGAALTFLGNAAGCDVRLSADSVHPLHCLLAVTAEGLLLRDLESETGTFVNGERVSTRPLRDGDLLAVGPYQLRLRLPPAAASAAESAAAVRKEKEALRIQAAAVAAQQAALAEQEARLGQRRATLEQQEGQLAAHLEDKRRRLVQLAEHAQLARTALEKERAEYARHVEKVTSDLGQAQRELLEGQKKAQAERQRFSDLRRRLKQRWHRHWTAERKTQRQHEASLAAERQRLTRENERLQQEKDALVQARLRLNGEMELGRRQVQADREALLAEQARWQAESAQAEADLAQRRRALAEREAALDDGRRLLEDERYRWEKGFGLLKRETEGLETRVHNQRRKVLEQRREINALELRLRRLHAQAAAAGLPPVPPPDDLPASDEGSVPLPAVEGGAPVVPPEVIALVASGVAQAPEKAPAVEAVPAQSASSNPPSVLPVEAPPAAPCTALALVPEPVKPPAAEGANTLAIKEARLWAAEAALQRRVALLGRLADQLADQRLLLAEHWERLARINHAWHEDRGAALVELEERIANLPAREESVSARERGLQSAEEDLNCRHEEAVRLRQHLEGWKARLHVRAAAWESERDQALADLRGREALAERHLKALVAVRQRWNKSRRRELDVVRAERAACEQLRQECATLREELWQRTNALEEERRLLAEKSLALEQYRQQYVVRATDASAAERRLERLRRRWVAQNAALVRATVAERQALQQEVARLEDRHTALHKQMEALAVRETNLAQRQTAWEEAQALAEAQQAKLQQELQSMQGQRDRHALHLIELQEEVERIARILLEEAQLPLLGPPQAA
jgi:hypothetical protein